MFSASRSTLTTHLAVTRVFSVNKHLWDNKGNRPISPQTPSPPEHVLVLQNRPLIV